MLEGQFSLISFVAGASAVTIVEIASYYFGTYSGSKQIKEITQKIDAAESKSKEGPENSKASWDVARLTLEKHFLQNIEQASLIYKLSLLSMIFGFGIIMFGVVLSYTQPANNNSGILAAVSGVVSQFIGATFLLLYKSSINRTETQMKMMERINSVGMAMQILDTMTEISAPNDLKSATKAKLIESFVNGSYASKLASDQNKELS
ncbi:TRADD-N-associated membrane domain-containing protein [Derxia gummosa]|uniref:TRADD-N-associated membrane domain-containing protein n=1 Tax=Derxia gummosa DSM 723 TaxID=1121388 RepID=A0A8B6XCF2_9BURK|nr:hypothetical protein [Derxia gummosa]